MKKFLLPLCVVVISIMQTACDNHTHDNTRVLSNKQIEMLILQDIKEKPRWGANIQLVTDTLGIPTTKTNVCQIQAIIDQESNYRANPSVPNLGKSTLKAMETKIAKYEQKLGPAGSTLTKYINDTLQNKPTKGNNYIYQIKGVKTEKDLYILNQQLISDLSKNGDSILKPLGIDLKQEFNFVKTVGSMQVHTDYAINHKRELIGDNDLVLKMFKHYDGLYYGVHRLMMYRADYDKPIYRFADYNSGMYSSRNAGFQKMLMTLTGKKVVLDGDLINYGLLSTSGETKDLLIAYFARFDDAPSSFQLKRDLQKEKTYDFQETDTYQFIAKKYQENTGKKAIYAIMPQVKLMSTKLKGKQKTTGWYAKNVNIRYERCMKRSIALK